MLRMRQLWPRKVGTKLLAVMLVGLGLSLSLALLAIWMVSRDATASSRALAIHAAENMALQVTAQMGEHDFLDPLPPFARYNIQRTLDYANRIKGRDAEIFDSNLKIVADTDHADLGRHEPEEWRGVLTAMLHDRQPRFFAEAARDDQPFHLQVAVPLQNQSGDLVGGVILEYTDLAEELAASARHSILVLLATSLIALLLMLYLAATTVRPIARAVRRLHGATRALATGKPVRPVGVQGSDELSELSRAFDEMSEQLSASRSAIETEVIERRAAQTALQDANTQLEHRVAERTASLESINRQLEDELAHGKEMERQLEQLARFDSLTGLPNRAMFLTCLDLAIKRADRSKSMVALMFIDLDRFKSINDSMGHRIGDQVLQQAAQRLSGCLREADVVSRIGGDEFTVILEDIADTDAARAVAAKIVAAFVTPVVIDEKELFLSSSVGIALYPRDSTDPGMLMTQADFAMYEAKANGRNQYALHSEQMASVVLQRLALENALHHAIERNELSLHYQLRISASDHLPTGTEALLRWQHPEMGQIAPGDFIPVAEHSGMILDIGEWALRRACEQHTEWREAGLAPGIMAVNISAVQFKQGDFVERVLRIVSETRMVAGQLELELTESMLADNPENAAAVMQQLRNHGIGLAIDDFGTGYSSLSYLKRFPASRIKIDRSFVHDIDLNQEDAAIAAAIVALARNLNIDVTAEGVETGAQLAHLAPLACADYQGFYFARPLPADEVRAALLPHTAAV
ncbi:Phytochrome-like protein cph2 [Amantichitinum ursilacus]|uniref:Phytochrome-like protein cph2 n=2 Tax=Amantichitinum ursilacus TaxID=857265 RepID=A0A0N0XKL8_9NEIS|nr:Phytochrome-like protein cph2 [Amantichitinum ursilacus]